MLAIHDFFIILLAILLSARIFAELACRAGAPAVIGELCAGILLGPSLLGWIEPGQVLHLLAEIGIILLLFEVGLETDIKQLLQTGLKPILVALTGVLAPLLGGFVLSYWLFELSLLISLFIGGTLTATSIGITVRVLTDLQRQHTPEAQIVLGAAVLDDIIGVILLAILYEFSQSGEVSLSNTGTVILFITVFMILAPFAARLMAELIRYSEHHSQLPGLIPVTVISLVLFFAWLSHAMGAPQLLGGFAAGLALSQRFAFPMGAAMRGSPEFSHRMESQIRPIIHLFTPIFFVMVGVSLNFNTINWHSAFVWQFSLALLLMAVVSKLIAGLLICEPWSRRWIIGMSMVPRGEVGLIFAELGRSSGILPLEIYAALILVIAITTLLPPFILKWIYRTAPPPAADAVK